MGIVEDEQAAANYKAIRNGIFTDIAKVLLLGVWWALELSILAVAISGLFAGAAIIDFLTTGGDAPYIDYIAAYFVFVVGLLYFLFRKRKSNS
jgi:hypothetical protein